MSQAPGLSGTPDCRPLLQRGHKRILCEVLGNADVAHHPRQAGDEPRRLDSPDRVNCPMCVGSLVTATHHTIFNPSAQASLPTGSRRAALARLRRNS